MKLTLELTFWHFAIKIFYRKQMGYTNIGYNLKLVYLPKQNIFVYKVIEFLNNKKFFLRHSYWFHVHITTGF